MVYFYFINIIRSNHYLCSARRESVGLCWHPIRCSSLTRAMGWRDKRTTALLGWTTNEPGDFSAITYMSRFEIFHHLVCPNKNSLLQKMNTRCQGFVERKTIWIMRLIRVDAILELLNTPCELPLIFFPTSYVTGPIPVLSNPVSVLGMIFMEFPTSDVRCLRSIQSLVQGNKHILRHVHPPGPFSFLWPLRLGLNLHRAVVPMPVTIPFS